jgi:hypothetical protein
MFSFPILFYFSGRFFMIADIYSFGFLLNTVQQGLVMCVEGARYCLPQLISERQGD